MSEAERQPTTGPDVALSEEDRKQAEAMIDVVDDLPTMTRDDLRERYAEKIPSSTLWSDEIDGAVFLEDDYRLPGLDLPGFGERRDDCGVEIPHFCTDCGHRIDVGRTCSQNRCPRCAPAWVTKRAPNMVARIHEAAKMKSAALPENTPVFKHHVVVSPPDDLFIDADNPLEEAFSTIRSLMHTFDMEGAVFYHGYRGSDDLEDDRGEWKKRLFNDREWGEVRQELEVRPHFHLVGCTPWVPGGDVVDKFHQETGWVLHRVTERNGSPVSLGDMSAVARAVTYCLSHTSIDTTGEANRAMYRKYGSAYHNADCRSIDDAKEAVNHVAPDTLGVPSMEVECRSKVADAGDDHDHLDDLEDGDGDGDLEQDATETDGLTTCRGDLEDIDEAQTYLTDEEWTRTVPEENVDELEETYQRWEELGGWRGWVDGQQSVEDVDTPPPD